MLFVPCVVSGREGGVGESPSLDSVESRWTSNPRGGRFDKESLYSVGTDAFSSTGVEDPYTVETLHCPSVSRRQGKTDRHSLGRRAVRTGSDTKTLRPFGGRGLWTQPPVRSGVWANRV